MNHDRPNRELTHSQLQISIGQRLHPEAPLYNMAFAFVLPTALDPDVFNPVLFKKAWHRVAEASDALRTRVVELPGGGLRRRDEPRDDEPGKVPGTFPAETMPGTVVPETTVNRLEHASEDGFLRWARERCAEAMPLDGPLVVSVLVPLEDGRTGWYLNQHHLVADAASTQLLFRLVGEQYEVLQKGDERPVAAKVDLPGYFEAYARQAARPAPATADEHWSRRRARAGRRVPLYGHSQVAGTRSTRLTLELGEEPSQSIRQLAQEPVFASLSPDLSRFAVYATLLSAWLHRVSGRRELGFDAPVGGRTTPDARRAPGLFIEMFPFASEVRPGDTFRNLGVRCLEEAMHFLRNASPGFSSPSGAEAGNVVLNFIPASFGDFAGARPDRIEWLHPGHGDNVHGLRLQVHDFTGAGATTLHFDWNERLMPERQRRRSLRHFEVLLDAALADPDREIASVDMLTDDERTMLASFNETASQPAPGRTVVDLFLEQAETTPGRVALRLIKDGSVEEGQPADEVTFAELRRRADAVAASLIEQGVEPGDRVAVLGTRTVESVVSILGILRARAAYVPIDPAYPQARQEHVLRDSGARHLLGTEESDGDSGARHLLGDPSIGAGSDGARHLPESPNDTDSNGARHLLEDESDGARHLSEDRPRLRDLAYLLYTSGSTGAPKGVLIEHSGLADYLGWAGRRYVRGDRLTFPLFTSLSFDLTVTSLFLPLITGGTLEIYPQPEGPVDSALLDVVRRNQVDFIKLTPSHLSLLRRAGLDGSRIRRMVVGGEDLKASLAAAISSQLHDQVEIHNEYGPTEAVVGCVAHLFDSAADCDGSVPIGAPADHVQAEVLDENGIPVPEGVPGELWISRQSDSYDGLARGYHGLPDLTAASFIEDDTGSRRYRTGDRVRFVRPGVLEFLGRVDRQVKVSGHRIEPGEIESAILRVPGIAECAVVTRHRHAADAGAVTTRQETDHCIRCGLPSNYPRAVLDDDGVCSVCRAYDRVREHAQAYFRTESDLKAVFEDARNRSPDAPYDCLMLYSGGKDSTYALCRLAEMGLRVRAFTLDNGYISDGAKENMRRVTEQMGVELEIATTPAMNAIFRDSLARFSNVCNGCFKTIYTLAMHRAHELGIPVVVTGLSRGQMFETRLTEEMFEGGRVRPEEVDQAVLASRKAYHRADDEVSRSLDVGVFRKDEIFEQVQIVDFYRYSDVPMDELYAYLQKTVPWVRPEDTGRSTNCLINDAGIFVHKAERGFHNYALPYSWDVRMGHKTRDEALDELNDDINEPNVRRILSEVGYEPREAGGEHVTLEAFYVAADGEALSADDLRHRLAEHLPALLIPSQFRQVDSIPLTVHGKVDEDALLAGSKPASESDRAYEPPDGPVEEYLADLWREELAVERVGAGDSFFELGGTSLLAMRVMLRLCQEFDIDLPLESAFSHPTLRGLSRVAEDRILADVEEL